MKLKEMKGSETDKGQLFLLTNAALVLCLDMAGGDRAERTHAGSLQPFYKVALIHSLGQCPEDLIISQKGLPTS